MTRLLKPVRFILAILGLAILPGSVTADVPEALQERQQQLSKALEKVRGAVVGVSDGMGVGSGVVVSRDGIVLTASHVVDAGRGRGHNRMRRGGLEHEVTITFPDGSQYRASILGKNADADAGVLKITDSPPTEAGFPFAEMGRTTETKVGEWCFALGHPGGFRPDRDAPIRVGRILSVGNRTVVSDCAILLGDSGGPLFNLDGKVIGIHSMITSLIIENRHVAIDSFHDDWDRLLAGDRWGRLRSADNDLIESGFFGVLLKWKDFVPEVAKVVPDSPAEKAGLEKGDVLLKIAGEPIADRLDLGTTLDLLEEDQAIKVQIRRKGKEDLIELVTGDDTGSPDDEDPSDDDEAVLADDDERNNEIMEQLSDNRRIGKFEKRTAEELKLYAPITESHKNSVVAIRDGGLLLCLGTVMSSDGYILTKASELDGAIDPEVILPNGSRFPAKELTSDHSYDLMLLKVDATDLQPAHLRKDPVAAGELAVLQDTKGNALIPTVVSVVTQTMEGATKAFMGVKPQPAENGVRIREVIPGGAAERNGIKPEDIIISIANREVYSPEQLINRIGEFKPGDKIAVRYMREDKIIEIEIVLTSKFTNEPLLPLYNSLDTDLRFASIHSSGFPRALQIDADVYPTKVGGPLLDLEGKAIGIVIARADRFPTFAIPADSVQTVFDQLKAEAANRKVE